MNCGVIIQTLGDMAKNVTPQVVYVEGDPDHPINRGTLCPKGLSLYQDILNERRLLKPQVRRAGSDHWEDIAWDQSGANFWTRGHDQWLDRHQECFTKNGHPVPTVDELATVALNIWADERGYTKLETNLLGM